MLRRAAAGRFTPILLRHQRQYASKSSSAKRALNKKQLAGEPAKVDMPKGSDSTINDPGTHDPTGGGGNFMLPLAFVATGAGAAWYFNVIPGFGREVTPETILPVNDTKKEPSANKREVTPETILPVKDTKKEPSANKREETASIAPDSKERKKEQIPETKKSIEMEVLEKLVNDVKQNKVEEQKKDSTPVEKSVSPVNSNSSKEAPNVPKTDSQKISEAKKEATASNSKPETTAKDSKPAKKPQASVFEATNELLASREQKASETLEKAHRVLRSSIDESLFSDLEGLSAAQLRVRVVQLGTEMMERTKWEAMRLKEFLAMKEKEVGEKYLEMMQKQRHEFENLLAMKLREQEDSLTRNANSILQQKENGIQAVVAAAKESLEAEHKANLASTEELLEAQLNLKYEKEYAQKLKDEKQQFIIEMEKKVSTIESLSKKLNEMDSILNMHQSITADSLKAHRLSAAALALTKKMETSKGAKAEVAALKGVLGDNKVISSAVNSMPKSLETGTPTLSELQTKFELIYDKCRQAALVPPGRFGLDGQLIGIVLSNLKYPLSADDPAPDDIKDNPEYILARARRFVSLGELETAVDQLKKLKGQAGFTIKDWKQSAENRVAIDKALQVIKMEVALMNESLSKSRQ